jgi:hypothetical protein
MKSIKKKSIKKKSVKKKSAKKESTKMQSPNLKSSNITFLGTGTWNDQRYTLLTPAAGGNQPSKPEEELRDHLRRNLSVEEYNDAKAQIAAGDRAAIAALVLSLKTNELDHLGRKLDIPLGTIAEQFQLTGGSDWTLALCMDRSIRDGISYYFEVERTK